MKLLKIITILTVFITGTALAGCQKAAYAQAYKLWEDIQKAQTVEEEGQKADELGTVTYRNRLAFSISVTDAGTGAPLPIEDEKLNGRKIAVTIMLDNKNVPGTWYPKDYKSLYAMMKE